MKTYGLGSLPFFVRRYIIVKATKQAGWESPERKGEEGSSMMMEWVTFALTADQWIEAINGHIGPCPDVVKGMLTSLDVEDGSKNN
jgi:hypothetical protein